MASRTSDSGVGISSIGASRKRERLSRAASACAPAVRQRMEVGKRSWVDWPNGRSRCSRANSKGRVDLSARIFMGFSLNKLAPSPSPFLLPRYLAPFQNALNLLQRQKSKSPLAIQSAHVLLVQMTQVSHFRRNRNLYGG